MAVEVEKRFVVNEVFIETYYLKTGDKVHGIWTREYTDDGHNWCNVWINEVLFEYLTDKPRWQ